MRKSKVPGQGDCFHLLSENSRKIWNAATIILRLGLEAGWVDVGELPIFHWGGSSNGRETILIDCPLTPDAALQSALVLHSRWYGGVVWARGCKNIRWLFFFAYYPLTSLTCATLQLGCAPTCHSSYDWCCPSTSSCTWCYGAYSGPTLQWFNLHYASTCAALTLALCFNFLVHVILRLTLRSCPWGWAR